MKNTFFWIAVCLAIVVVFRLSMKTAPPAQPREFYYTGPMYNFRNGKYVTIDGKVVPPPPRTTVPARAQFMNKVPKGE